MTSRKIVPIIIGILISIDCHALSMESKKPFLRRIRSVIAPFTLPWYENGLNFECTGCGKCCKVDGDVWLAPEEVGNIMAHLGFSNDDTNKNSDDDDDDDDERNVSSVTYFRKKYIRAEVSPANNGDESQSWMCLKRKEGACVFLDHSGKCSIYAARPVQCKTYPFWPSLLTDPETWEEESVIPDNIVIQEGSSDRHWSPENGGCEGIMVRTIDDESEDGSNVVRDWEAGVGVVVDRKEIQSKMKEAAHHWKRFPVQEIKESTWYL